MECSGAAAGGRAVFLPLDTRTGEVGACVGVGVGRRCTTDARRATSREEKNGSIRSTRHSFSPSHGSPPATVPTGEYCEYARGSVHTVGRVLLTIARISTKQYELTLTNSHKKRTHGGACGSVHTYRGEMRRRPRRGVARPVGRRGRRDVRRSLRTPNTRR
jgi:hypothetical protein